MNKNHLRRNSTEYYVTFPYLHEAMVMAAHCGSRRLRVLTPQFAIIFLFFPLFVCVSAIFSRFPTWHDMLSNNNNKKKILVTSLVLKWVLNSSRDRYVRAKIVSLQQWLKRYGEVILLTLETVKKCIYEFRENGAVTDINVTKSILWHNSNNFPPFRFFVSPVYWFSTARPFFSSLNPRDCVPSAARMSEASKWIE